MRDLGSRSAKGIKIARCAHEQQVLPLPGDVLPVKWDDLT